MGRFGRTEPNTSATQSTGPVITTPTRGGKGSRPHVLKVKEPAPGSLRGKEPAPAARKTKEPAPAGKKGKEPAPAARKSIEPAPAGRKTKWPGAGTVTEPQPPTVVVQPSEVPGDGQEPPPSSITTSTEQPSEVAGDGQEAPPTSSTTTSTEQPSEVCNPASIDCCAACPMQLQWV
ncbi:hypothetical protein NDU88_001611 [Pleurodeles waltl]|uniref:Uncharacterized protein n=1 Tax=Pleurodeles waltl TaxID=8319 RepID=A0AAV7UVU3_PLEWA|nr:hypothetical protein NDU88_001611 [Pleurodeles waltl]